MCVRAVKRVKRELIEFQIGNLDAWIPAVLGLPLMSDVLVAHGHEAIPKLHYTKLHLNQT